MFQMSLDKEVNTHERFMSIEWEIEGSKGQIEWREMEGKVLTGF